MMEFATKFADLQAKHEVSGDPPNGRSSLESEYYKELNLLMAKYRALFFEAAMDYIVNDTATNLMVELVQNDDKK